MGNSTAARERTGAKKPKGAITAGTVKRNANLKPFKPGQSGNPHGRGKGSRNKLSEAFINAMHEDFEEAGIEVIREVRRESPVDYLRLVASIVPKQFGLEEGTQNAFLEVWKAISEGRA
jgi:hypothetical protein